MLGSRGEEVISAESGEPEITSGESIGLLGGTGILTTAVWFSVLLPTLASASICLERASDGWIELRQPCWSPSFPCAHVTKAAGAVMVARSCSCSLHFASSAWYCSPATCTDVLQHSVVDASIKYIWLGLPPYFLCSNYYQYIVTSTGGKNHHKNLVWCQIRRNSNSCNPWWLKS